jgi:hypothetical protein
MIIILVFAFVFACLAAHGFGAWGSPRNWGYSMGWLSIAFYFGYLLLPALFGALGHR